MPESMQLSTVKKMLPKEVMDVVKLHKPKTYQELRDLIRVEVRENRETLQEAKTKHAQVLEAPVSGEDGVADADGNDEELFYWDYDLCTFVSWGKRERKRQRRHLAKSERKRKRKGYEQGIVGEPDWRSGRRKGVQQRLQPLRKTRAHEVAVPGARQDHERDACRRSRHRRKRKG